MKKSLLLFLILCAGIISYAQCDKKLVLNSSKTEYLDSTKTVMRTVDENSVIELNKAELIITPGGEDNRMSGPVKSTSCNWKIPFKEGKTIVKATLTDPSGDSKNVTITIEGKEGKLTLLAEVDDDPNHKIRVAIDNFEEKT